MSYRIEQNDNDIFFILYHFFTIKERSAIYLVKNKNNEKCPSQSNFYR